MMCAPASNDAPTPWWNCSPAATPATLRPLPDRQGSGKAVTQLVAVADLGLIDGSRPDGSCEILGTGPVPPSVLDNLSPDASVCGIIFGGKGRVLWLGRNQRLGNGAQRLAAAVRDRGCVRCDAPVHRTELHHLRDWYDGGPTDIDNLVSLCGPHHRQLLGTQPGVGKNRKQLAHPPAQRPARPSAAPVQSSPRPRRPRPLNTPSPWSGFAGLASRLERFPFRRYRPMRAGFAGCLLRRVCFKDWPRPRAGDAANAVRAGLTVRGGGVFLPRSFPGRRCRPLPPALRSRRTGPCGPHPPRTVRP